MTDDLQDTLKAENPRDQRKLFLWSWLALIILYNAFIIFSLLRGGADPNLGYVTTDLPTAGAGIVIGVIGRAAIILFALITAFGYKLGVYGLAGAYVVAAIGSLMSGFNIGTLLEVGLAVGVVWLLTRGAWHTMK